MERGEQIVRLRRLWRCALGLRRSHGKALGRRERTGGRVPLRRGGTAVPRVQFLRR
jgi:hypothetical protein